MVSTIMELKPVSWGDMCKTSNDESGQEDNEEDDKDDFWKVDKQDEVDKIENAEYRMDTLCGPSKWKWDDEVFMANSSKKSMLLKMMMMDLRTS